MLFNIGNSNPVNLKKYIETIEINLGKKAIKELLPMQPGDVKATSANTKLLEEWVSFKPNTTIEDGVNKFVNWYKIYYEV